MNKIRILIVEDSVPHRMLLSTIIEEHPMLEVVGTAQNGQVALQMIERLQPDLVTLDIQMPIMDGIQTIKELRVHWPLLPSIVISGLSGAGADAGLDALALGARHCIEKPTMLGGWEANLKIFRESVHSSILAVCGSEYVPWQGKPVTRTPLPKLKDAALTKKIPTNVKVEIVPHQPRAGSVVHVLAIGISTGGPDALTRLLPLLPANIPVPVVIVQHMPPGFTQKLARRLNELSALNVKEACAGDVLKAGTVYIAPGDYHMVLETNGAQVAIALDQDPLENSCRPAVDKLFRSVCDIYGASCLAVIMTGMGKDGLLGAELLSREGAQIVVQDEASSVVWGMPGYVARAGLADEIVPLNEMAQTILSRLSNSGLGGSLNCSLPTETTVNQRMENNLLRKGS